MKKIHQKRLTPRNLLLDIMNALYSHGKILKLIEQLLINEPSLDIKDIDLINSKLNIDLHDESRKIMNSVTPIFNEYNDHSYWRAFEGEEISLNENTTLGETVFYLGQMTLSADCELIISHILNGNLNWLYNHLVQLTQHSDNTSDQVMYDNHSGNFERILRSLDNRNNFELSIKLLKRVINKLKPLRPIRNINGQDSYLCPKCNQILFSTSQKHCQNCGQRMYTKPNWQKKGDDSYNKI